MALKDHQVKPLSSITTLRKTQPGGNARHFTNMQPTVGRRALCPGSVGSCDGWHQIGGNADAKVDKL